MLELGVYTYAELSAYLGTTGNQATERKLNSYGIQFSGDGRGQDMTYTITAIPDRFKVFCVFDLHLSPQTNFDKFRDFLFYLFGDDDFCGKPMEAMEEYLRIEGRGITRQTISNYIRRLSDRDLIHLGGEYVYYRVFKNCGAQTHQTITKEEYCEAWKTYFDCKAKHYDSRAAYSHMYNQFGGVPRKQRKIEQNAFNADILNTLEALVMDSYDADYGDE